MGWAEAVTAISAAIIAISLVIGGFFTTMLLIELRKLLIQLNAITKTLDEDGKPALVSLRSVVDDASDVVATVKSEVEGLAETSKDIRKRAERAAASIDDRLHDIEALVDVVQEEVEETALDVAAAVRTTRRGGKLFRRMKRALGRRGGRR